MQFNSYEFVLCFLPITVILYFLGNHIRPFAGKMVLILASLVFYAHERLNMLFYLGASILTNYLFAILIRKFKLKSRLIMMIPIIINVVALLYFKYSDFVVSNLNSFTGKNIDLWRIVLPLGISFYTFQQIAYIVAIERWELKNNSLTDYLVYILYFPKLIMGPIVDPVDFIGQINQKEKKRIDIHNLAVGIKLFSLGLIKKVLLADTFAKAVAWVYGNFDFATSMDCILLVLFYTFEIYFDFSGYSDMAVGISSMMNIELPMNFDSPYKAISIKDFWKRWHVSLTKFLTKYIYIPLGGSRKGIVFTYINIMIVFMVSGIWHGANWTFILWGFLHGLISCFNRALQKTEEKIFMPVRWLCTFGCVNVLWLLFSAESIGQWKAVIKRILSMQSTEISSGLIGNFNLAESQFICDMLFIPDRIQYGVRGFNMLVFILAACIICFIPENNFRKIDKLSFASLILSVLSFVWGVLRLGSESVFVYFGF